ncbi:hypothetical protein QZH41_012585 [Actinostola sp. cb2023]|nr:hypothetical protein QZH41_012585 [Actinostola sp. cb2023]
MEAFDVDVLKTNAFNDLIWSLKSYDPKRYKYSVQRNPEQIKRHVLESRRVSHIIEETAKEQGKTITEIKDEAKAILDEMGHNYSMKTLRFMAFIMKKILSTLLRKVLVNQKGLERKMGLMYNAGLLSMVVDLYANAGVPNVLLCPISISYDKVPEESLFAYELLGIPKPRESLRGLISSRSVLSEDYGNIYINFGELIPLSSCIEGKLDRMATASTPRHLLLYLSEEEKEVVRQTGYDIIAKLQASMVVTSSVIVAAIMLQNQQGLLFDDVVTKFDWLQDLFKMLQIPLAPADYPKTKDIVKDGINFQKSSLEIDSDGFVRIKEPQTIPETQSGSAIAHASRQQHHVVSSVKDVIDEAAIHLLLAYKRNTLLPYFFGIGMVAVATWKQHNDLKEIGILTEDFNFLSTLLIQEVSGLAESLPKVFQQTLEVMQENNMLVYSSNNCFTVEQEAYLEFAAGLWMPLLTAYWVVAEYLMKSTGSEEKSIGDVQRGAQHLAAEYVLSGTTTFYEVLSLELLKNAIEAFKDIKVVAVLKRPKAKVISVPDRNSLRMIHQRIGEFLHLPRDSKYISPPLSKL